MLRCHNRPRRVLRRHIRMTLAKTIIVSIDSAGTIKINQQVYDKSQLGPALLEIFRTRNERVMFVNADAELLYKEVVDVIDIAKGSGVDKIGLMTDRSRARAQVGCREA